MEDRRQRGSGVFDVDIDVAGQERAIADQRTAQIETPPDGQAGVALDRLRDDLAENQLLGEVLRSDDDHARRVEASAAAPASASSASDPATVSAARRDRCDDGATVAARARAVRRRPTRPAARRGSRLPG